MIKRILTDQPGTEIVPGFSMRRGGERKMSPYGDFPELLIYNNLISLYTEYMEIRGKEAC